MLLSQIRVAVDSVQLTLSVKGVDDDQQAQGVKLTMSAQGVDDDQQAVAQRPLSSAIQAQPSFHASTIERDQQGLFSEDSESTSEARRLGRAVEGGSRDPPLSCSTFINLDTPFSNCEPSPLDTTEATIGPLQATPAVASSAVLRILQGPVILGEQLMTLRSLSVPMERLLMYTTTKIFSRKCL